MAGQFLEVECPELVEGRFVSGHHFLMAEMFPMVDLPDRVLDLAWGYIVQTGDGSLYIGHSHDVRERLRKHRFGLGSKFTNDDPVPRSVSIEGPFPLAAAVAREFQVKRWTRAKKEALIRGDMRGLHELSKSKT